MEYEGGNNDTQDYVNTAEAHDDEEHVMTGRSYEDDGFVIENSPLVVF